MSNAALVETAEEKADPRAHYRLGRDLPLDMATARAIAVQAGSDPRSVIKEFRAFLGQNPHVKGGAGFRIRKALTRAGLLPTPYLAGPNA